MPTNSTPAPRLALRCRLSELPLLVRQAATDPAAARQVAAVRRADRYTLAGLLLLLALAGVARGCPAAPAPDPCPRPAGWPAATPYYCDESNA